MRENVKKQLDKIPEISGVYIFKSKQGEVLYVGKANCLKDRVRSYFGKNVSGKFKKMVTEIDKIDYIITSNEPEALLVEHKLIKQDKPKYNVMYRDDKSYPVVEITDSKFPRIYITREQGKQKSLYLGPFTNANLLKEGLRYLRKIIPYRTCQKLPEKHCLDYDLGLCPAPCEDKINSENYLKLIDEVKLYLKGEKGKLIKKLKKQMLELSEDKKYERAAEIRDKMKALSKIKQEVGIDGKSAALYKLEQELNLSKFPEYIEAFDISNISGKEAVGSMIAFKDGSPYKKNYRRFKIKGQFNVSSNFLVANDYKMMEEVLLRRYSRVVKEKMRLADLIVIDGGKGHLNIAINSLGKIGIEEKTNVVAIAKKFDYVFCKRNNNFHKCKLKNEHLNILKKIRDEAHRFANTYHSILRNKLTKVSDLDNIPGIGFKRKKNLLKYFGSVKKIKSAEESELIKVKNIYPGLASKIKDYFIE